MTKLQLLTTKTFNGCVLDCYVEPAQTDKGDFWATREQIGQLLGYVQPEVAITKIHDRHAERMDKFSTITKLVRVEGGREVTREVFVYNFKGLLEICRYSNQPTADAVMDVLWEIADEIRRTGSYSAKKKLPANSFKAAEALIDKVFKCKTEADCEQIRTLDKVFQGVYGYSVLEVGEIQPEAQPEPEPRNRRAEIWEHIVARFAPDEWFTTSELKQSLDEVHLCIRQVRRYLLSFVANKQLKRRGSYKGTEYSINKHPRP